MHTVVNSKTTLLANNNYYCELHANCTFQHYTPFWLFHLKQFCISYKTASSGECKTSCATPPQSKRPGGRDRRSKRKWTEAYTQAPHHKGVVGGGTSACDIPHILRHCIITGVVSCDRRWITKAPSYLIHSLVLETTLAMAGTGEIYKSTKHSKPSLSLVSL